MNNQLNFLQRYTSEFKANEAEIETLLFREQVEIHTKEREYTGVIQELMTMDPYLGKCN